MNNKELLFATIEELQIITGIPTSYNGNYLFFDDGGQGYSIEIDSYLEGIRLIEGMKVGYILAKKGKFL